MDVDEREHLTRLRGEHVKHLRILELKQAKMGVHTPEYIPIEIGDLSEKIAAIDVQLNGSGVPSIPSPVSASSWQTAQIEVVFKGDFGTLTPELQRAMIRAIAALADISPEQVQVLIVMSGSIIFRVKMPKDAADRLLKLYQSHDSAIEDVDIVDVRGGQVPEAISTNTPSQPDLQGTIAPQEKAKGIHTQEVTQPRKQSTEHLRDAYARCLAAVEECDAALGWGIDAAERQDYAAAMTTFLADDATDDQLRDTAANYHADHAMVAALRDSTSPNHDRHWEQWMRQVLVVLRRAGLDWSSDGAIDSDDLAQIARAELVRALSSYRYQYRFSIWAGRVVVQSVRRHLRDSQRAKRAVRPESLDQLAELDSLLASSANTTSISQARVLYDMIMDILAEQPDQRWRYLFQLAAVDDLRVDEISKLAHLSQPRVRALLQQIRQLLQQHPAIRAWLTDKPIAEQENISDTRRAERTIQVLREYLALAA